MSPFVTRLGSPGGPLSGSGVSKKRILLPTYQISQNNLSIDEGNSVSFVITTTNVTDGTVLYWTTTGTTTSYDFTDDTTTGSVTITNNTGTISRPIKNDFTSEGSQNFQLQIRTQSNSGPIVVTSPSITINDTSTTSSGIFTTPGTYIWFAPEGVTSVSVVCIGGGGAGGPGYDAGGVNPRYVGGGGGGGGLGWKNNISVTPGVGYLVVVGSGGAETSNNTTSNVFGNSGTASYFINTSTVRGAGGSGGSGQGTGGSGGGYVGDGGGNGGSGGNSGGAEGIQSGGGGAGGYSGNGGAGGSTFNGSNGSGGGGGGGGAQTAAQGKNGGGGGGTGIFGQGSSGSGGQTVNNPEVIPYATGGGGGSGGTSGETGDYGNSSDSFPSQNPTGLGKGGLYGGGSGGSSYVWGGTAKAGDGAVRIVYSSSAFP